MTILCYHTVDPGWVSPLAVPPGAFDRHCGWLSRNRRVLDLATAVGQLDSRGLLPAGSTALTFDDGFRGIYDHALPVLRRYGLPATVFVVARTLMPDWQGVDWIDEAPSPSPGVLTPDHLRELEASGVGIGSHSYAHHDLRLLGDVECERDLRHSREILEDVVGHPVTTLAYPRGRHDERVRAAASRAGFTHAFTLPEGMEPRDPLAVPRVGVYPGNGVRALDLKTRRPYLRMRTSRLYPCLRASMRRVRSLVGVGS